MAGTGTGRHALSMPHAPELRVRRAAPSDAAAVAGIYNEGIAERGSTFETQPRRPLDVIGRLTSSSYPALVAALGGEVVGWAWLAPYSDRPAYAGVAECSVYVRAGSRGRGVGTRLTENLAARPSSWGSTSC